MFKSVKLPDGYSTGVLFDLAAGRQVDIFAERIGIQRKKWFILKEPDWSLKKRILSIEIENLSK
ncbi:hypothetical protein [Paenibacillus sp. UNC451MF]|uniref:hypothetical protein n=1 Tax=Paenibacillus sp. UNC451MF TaxID=1449063 RepID=UPI00048C7D03|nr:hypothetical protein [Paenibacillus sp. UNC451MF]